MFYVTGPRITDGANFIKLLLLLFTNVRDKQVFVPDEPFRLSLLFTGKPTEAKHLSGATILGRLLSFLLTL
jgi:hypothetical protein